MQQHRGVHLHIAMGVRVEPPASALLARQIDDRRIRDRHIANLRPFRHLAVHIQNKKRVEQLDDGASRLQKQQIHKLRAMVRNDHFGRLHDSNLLAEAFLCKVVNLHVVIRFAEHGRDFFFVHEMSARAFPRQQRHKSSGLRGRRLAELVGLLSNPARFLHIRERFGHRIHQGEEQNVLKAEPRFIAAPLRSLENDWPLIAGKSGENREKIRSTPSIEGPFVFVVGKVNEMKLDG